MNSFTNLKKLDVLDYSIFIDDLRMLHKLPKGVINTINPHSYCIAKRDVEFQKALKNSDILLPDGVGIVWASKVLKKQNIKKIAGYDMFIHIMQTLERESGSCFFLGASNETLLKIKQRAAIEFPNVIINSYSPPYKPVFSEADNAAMIAAVNNVKPQVLFVGLTAPKQEKWVYQNKRYLDVSTICSIGAVFDFYSGNVERSSPFWIKLGLEWLPRLLKEPKRLFYRNFVSTPQFIIDVLRKRFFKMNS